jgi:hypothetical protein
MYLPAHMRVDGPDRNREFKIPAGAAATVEIHESPM